MDSVLWLFAVFFVAICLLFIAGLSLLLIEFYLWRRRGKSTPWVLALWGSLGLFLFGLFSTLGYPFGIGPTFMLAATACLVYAVFVYIRARNVQYNTWQRMAEADPGESEAEAEITDDWPPPPNIPQM